MLDLLFQLKDAGIKLTLAGGYGLALKQEYLQVSGLQPMLALIPQARTTTTAKGIEYNKIIRRQYNVANATGPENRPANPFGKWKAVYDHD